MIQRERQRDYQKQAHITKHTKQKQTCPTKANGANNGNNKEPSSQASLTPLFSHYRFYYILQSNEYELVSKQRKKKSTKEEKICTEMLI